MLKGSKKEINKEVNKEVNKDYIIQELMNLIEADISEYITIIKHKTKIYRMNIRGEIEEQDTIIYDVEYKELSKLTKKQRQRIKSIESGTDGKIKIILYDRQKALETLYDILNEVTINNGFDTGNFKDLDTNKLLEMLEGDYID